MLIFFFFIFFFNFILFFRVRRKEPVFLRTPKLPNQGLAQSFLLTPNLLNQGLALSFLPTPNLPGYGVQRKVTGFLQTPNLPNQGWARFFLRSPNLPGFGERNCPFSELRTCQTRVQPSSCSLLRTLTGFGVRRKELAFLRTPNLPNQGSAQFLPPTLNLPGFGVQRKELAFLRTPNLGYTRFFSELRTCQTRVIPVLSPISELKLRTPGKKHNPEPSCVL